MGQGLRSLCQTASLWLCHRGTAKFRCHSGRRQSTVGLARMVCICSTLPALLRRSRISERGHEGALSAILRDTGAGLQSLLPIRYWRTDYDFHRDSEADLKRIWLLCIFSTISKRAGAGGLNPAASVMNSLANTYSGS